jgi:quercetin dioxygenase-like cupin family protein
MLKKFAILENNVIVNISVAEDKWPFDHDHIELTDDQHVDIGWTVKNGEVQIPYSALPNAPTETQVSDTSIKYTFAVGQELAMHNHKEGGKHTTEILSGSFKIIRNDKETTATVGDKLKFTKTENHSITAIEAGEILNTQY